MTLKKMRFGDGHGTMDTRGVGSKEMEHDLKLLFSLLKFSCTSSFLITPWFLGGIELNVVQHGEKYFCSKKYLFSLYCVDFHTELKPRRKLNILEHVQNLRELHTSPKRHL
jgi:hypothetical protein